jgi:hypothetical protein
MKFVKMYGINKVVILLLFILIKEGSTDRKLEKTA